MSDRQPVEALVAEWKDRAARLAAMEKLGGMPILSSRRVMLENCADDLKAVLDLRPDVPAHVECAPRESN